MDREDWNERYRTTNTAASLLTARAHLVGHEFVKLDGDVTFDVEILRRLLARPAGPSYVCVDRSHVTAEVIKVLLDASGRVLRIGNDVPVADASGESIGIELVTVAGGVALFDALDALAGDAAHDQSYYEVAYDRIIRAGAPFAVVDVTGLRWVEMDDLADHAQAQAYFGTP